MPALQSATVDPLKKTGFQLRLSIVEAVRNAVKEGAAESQNAFVERALIRELKDLRRRRVYDAYAEASEDPAFLRDMQATRTAYEITVAEGL